MADDYDTKIGGSVLTASATVLVAAGVAFYTLAPRLGLAYAGLGGLLLLLACGITFVLSFATYLGLLHDGGLPYQGLRRRLAAGGTAVEIYANRLEALLDAVDRVLGDKDHPGQRAFGLRTPKPLWTAESYDRTLLLALLYPIVTVFIVWVLYGESGQAETVLELKAGVSEGRRLWSALVVVGMAGSLAAALRGTGWTRWAWLAVGGGMLLLAGLSGAGAVALAVAGLVIWGQGWADARDRRPLFLDALTLALAAACVGLPDVLAAHPGWAKAGPLLLFYGLLTLVNAPFDWAAIGLTRGLLRLGIEKKGGWPWGLAVADAGAALALIAVLTMVTVEAVQVFDGMAVRGGGTAVLDLGPLLEEIAHAPAAHRHWWIYALLLSTLIPSLVNLTIGGASLVRGLPGLSGWLARRMPADQPPPPADRLWMAGRPGAGDRGPGRVPVAGVRPHPAGGRLAPAGPGAGAGMVTGPARE